MILVPPNSIVESRNGSRQMPESTTTQRENWRTYECQSGKMTRIQFGSDSILVAPPTVDAWAALATVINGHGYVLRTPDTDSYNCREIKGGGGRSLHAYGIALDVNWDTNPYKTTSDGRAVRFSTKPTQGERGDDVRLGRADTDMTPAMIADVLAIRTKNGKRVFEWGGNWKTVKDSMHFEIDVAPDDLATGIDPKSIGVGGGAPVVTARPTLKRGSIGEQVKLVQAALMLDGIFGSETESAVRRFQSYRGIEVDGIVGEVTWSRLEPLLPKPPEEVPPSEEQWHENIIATVFGGSSETEQSAYDGHRITDSEFGVALPFRFSEIQRPKVEVQANNKSVICEIVDVGPWETQDPYWETNSRPKAESGTDSSGRTTNKAGIDLTPAAARAINLSGKGAVRWRFIR